LSIDKSIVMATAVGAAIRAMRAVEIPTFAAVELASLPKQMER
jgi:hypothetical protein